MHMNLMWEQGCVDDNYEENDSHPGYNLIFKDYMWLSTIDGWGVQNDVDWYEIWVTPDYADLEIEIAFVHAEGDIPRLPH